MNFVPSTTITLHQLTEFALRAFAKSVLAIPAPVLRAVFGPAPQSDTGTTLESQTHGMLCLNERAKVPIPHNFPVEKARAHFRRTCRIAADRAPELARVQDSTLPAEAGSLRVRVYTPRTTVNPLPLLVYFHGGGFVLGDLDSHDVPCRLLAKGGDCIVVAVDYGLAPEHPFPAPPDQAAQAFTHIAEHAADFGGDPARVAVGGDSAGANLAAVVCHRQRDTGGRQPMLQLLAYPTVDATLSHPSHKIFSSGYLLDKDGLEWSIVHYLRDRDKHATNPDASPLLAKSLAGLPKALIVTAGFDPLRDEGKAYADALAAADVPVTYRCHDNLIHGFLNMGGLVNAARTATKQLAHDLGRQLSA